MDKENNKAQFLQENDLSMYGMEAGTNNNNEYAVASKLQHTQMIKLIAKGFYKELISYGIDKNGVIAVSTHLLDHLMRGNEKLKARNENNDQQFAMENIKDEWNRSKRLTVNDVSILPIQQGLYAQVALWLRDTTIRYSFVTLFPDRERALEEYFEQSNRDYFAILYQNEPVGIIGADRIDNIARKLEMRKFIGNTSFQGKGIGKSATFLFLYYSFVILKFNKVYIYSGNTNIRNINLNSRFGFELEGVFFEDAFIGNKKRDIVRMGLLKSRWLEIFSNA